MDAAVTAWLEALPEGRQAEARALVGLFSAATGQVPRMWGTMVGFGRYAYRYDSGHGGESFPAGFALRGREIALYVLSDGNAAALGRLGPHRAGKGCLYVRSLAGIDLGVLDEIIRARVAEVAARWTILPG
jgi:hypothetical protein